MHRRNFLRSVVDFLSVLPFIGQAKEVPFEVDDDYEGF
jgi:hypothetical protein